MAIISLHWLNCVTDLVALSYRRNEQFRAKYCEEKLQGEKKSAGRNRSSLTSCGTDKEVLTEVSAVGDCGMLNFLIAYFVCWEKTMLGSVC